MAKYHCHQNDFLPALCQHDIRREGNSAFMRYDCVYFDWSNLLECLSQLIASNDCESSHAKSLGFHDAKLLSPKSDDFLYVRYERCH